MLIILFYLIPVVLTVIMSFTGMDFTLEWKFVGLKNYIKLCQDKSAGIAALNTLKYVASTLLINVGFGFLLAITTTYFTKKTKHGTFVSNHLDATSHDPCSDLCPFVAVVFGSY